EPTRTRAAEPTLEFVRQRRTARGADSEPFGAIAQQRLELRVALQALGHRGHTFLHTLFRKEVLRPFEPVKLTRLRLPVGDEPFGAAIGIDPGLALGGERADSAAGLSFGSLGDQGRIL